MTAFGAQHALGQITLVNSSFVAVNSNTVTGTVPALTVAGDIMVAAVSVRGSGQTINVPVGWTSVQSQSMATMAQRVFYKFAAAGEPNPVFSWTNPDRAVITILSYRNVASVVLAESSGQATPSSTTITAPGFNLGANSSMLVGFFGIADNRAAFSGSTLNPLFGAGVEPGSGAGPNGIRVYVGDLLVNPPSTVQRQVTSSHTADNIGQMLALRPPPSTVNPGSFNAFETGTAAAAIVGNILTKVAGTAFSLDVVAIQGGAQLSSFSNAVIVELLGNAALGVPLDAQNCPTSFTLLQTVSPNPTITNGRSTVSFAAVSNSWRDVRVRIMWPTASPTVTSCSTDNFAIRPSSFTAAATDSNWSTAGATRTLANAGAVGGNVHKAGQPFTLTVTPAPGTATNYDGSPTVSALACTLPAACANGTLTVGAFTGSGTRTSTTASYSEAGAFNLTLVDQTYANVDAGDGTPADCSAAGRYVCQSPAPVAVGRFVPNHFSIAAVTQPVFRTFDATDAACTTPASGPVRSFTYIGQFFGYQTVPAALVIAQNASGVTTTNYRGALWKLVPASVTRTLANSPVMSLDVTQMGASVLSEIANSGTGTLTSNAADKFAFVRNAVTPQAAFTANLALTWSVADANENSANQGVISTTTPLAFNGGGTGIAFDGGGASSGKDFLYGRLSIFNANGSNLIALPIRIFAQYWNGTSFIVNTADNCTALAGTNIEMSNFQNLLGPIASCKTRLPAAITFNSGRARALLLAPGAGVLGSVNLTVHLEPVVSGLPQTCTGGTPSSVTGANRDYLQGNWSGAAYNQNPLGIAIFGVYPGSAETIHTRENY